MDGGYLQIQVQIFEDSSSRRTCHQAASMWVSVPYPRWHGGVSGVMNFGSFNSTLSDGIRFHRSGKVSRAKKQPFWNQDISRWYYLGGGFKYFFVSPCLGKLGWNHQAAIDYAKHAFWRNISNIFFLSMEAKETAELLILQIQLMFVGTTRMQTRIELWEFASTHK